MDCRRSITCLLVVCLLGSVTHCAVAAGSLEEKAADADKIEQMRQEAEQAKRQAEQKAKQEDFEKAMLRLEQTIADIDLPEDTTARMTVRQVNLAGNTLISTDKLLEKMPLIYNASELPLDKAESKYLYDFRVLREITLEPGKPRQVSARTIQGLTQYILSVYRQKNYSGIYVYVPVDAVSQGVALRNDILPIKVLEAKVTAVTIKTYDPNQNQTEKGYLKRSAVEQWSPIKAGQVANQKRLDDFVNLLNLNPDRYVSATVTPAVEPNSLAVAYDIYEANPWHLFIQADNSGTSERQWNPRIGFINTNLLGIDDRFTAIYQAPWDSTLNENYSLYGSYDFPLSGPGLRLNLYGGYSEFDISPEAGPFGFLGSGSFYGGELRYNLLQADGWFVDVKGSIEHTRSKVKPDFPPFAPYLAADVKFWLAGGGLDVHRSDDMSRTNISLDWSRSLGGESSGSEFGLARTNSDSIFALYEASAAHSQYLDPDKIGRLSGSVRWIGSDERLVPAKMTAFGGMYTVRGYDEYEYVADGGVLASVQYEFDLVKYDESLEKTEAPQQQTSKPFLRKLAPLAFFDYGRGKIREPVGTEVEHKELMSVGTGAIVELGDNFSGAVYYGYPLNATSDTREGKGRVNVAVMGRW